MSHRDPEDWTRYAIGVVVLGSVAGFVLGSRYMRDMQRVARQTGTAYSAAKHAAGVKPPAPAPGAPAAPYDRATFYGWHDKPAAAAPPAAGTSAAEAAGHKHHHRTEEEMLAQNPALRGALKAGTAAASILSGAQALSRGAADDVPRGSSSDEAAAAATGSQPQSAVPPPPRSPAPVGGAARSPPPPPQQQMA